MQNPVSRAVSEIIKTIPRQILKVVFGFEDYNDWRRPAPVSIDEMIKSKVIRSRVLVDCNLRGGKQVFVRLDGLQGHQQDTFVIIYNIPTERTGGREITSVLSVNYMPNYAASGILGAPYGTSNPITSSDIAATGQRVMDSFANVPHVSTAQAEIIGYNTVSIRDEFRSTQAYELRCMIANEENMSNLQPKSYDVFADACKLAVQSYIYNQLFITIDQGRLEQGMDLGAFKEYVDRFADSEEKYQVFKNEVLEKVLFMNDTLSYDRFIQAQINPGL